MNARITALVAAAAAVLALAGCSTGSGSAPLPQGPAASVSAPAPEASTTTCDVVREALLTGSPAQIMASMEALIADKTAPATAREYARYYTVRDKGNKEMQTMDESLIQISCTA